MLKFVVGVVAGGVAGFYCRRDISAYLNRQMPPIRDQIANSLRSVEEGTSGALVRLRTAISTRLRNAEHSLRTVTPRPGSAIDH